MPRRCDSQMNGEGARQGEWGGHGDQEKPLIQNMLCKINWQECRSVYKEGSVSANTLTQP